MSKLMIVILIIVLLGGGIWWWFAANNQNTALSPTGQSNNVSGAAAGATADQIVSTDTSDAALDQSLANIDGQLNGLASDSANVDASLNQPVTVQ